MSTPEDVGWIWVVGQPIPTNAPEHVRQAYQYVSGRVGTWKDAPSWGHRLLWNKARDACIAAMLDYLLDAEPPIPVIRTDASKVLRHHAEELTMLADQLGEAGF